MQDDLVSTAMAQAEGFPTLLEMLVDYPLELPLWPQLRKQPQSDIYHLIPKVYKL